MAHVRMSAEIGRVLGGRYRLVAPIGMGASAQVFLADDVRLRRRVAVKMLHDALADDTDFLRRFRAEARAAAALSHPNVVAVYDWGDEEIAFIVTEYLEGGSLRALLDRGEVLSPSQALTVGLEAARALDYAHRRGFVHRDIKPANLLFGDDQRLRIADFGLARALAEAAWTEPQGAMLGTARYASPEQAKGEKLSGKADVYALALVIVEAVTGDVPFRTDTTLGTLMARVDRPLEVPEALGPLHGVLEKAGHPDPDQRIDARALAAGLLRAAKELSRPAPLPLAGALSAGAVQGPDRDPTLHAPIAPAEPEPSDVGPELDDEDLDLDPPDWVSNAAPPLVAAAAFGAGAFHDGAAEDLEEALAVDGGEDPEGADGEPDLDDDTEGNSATAIAVETEPETIEVEPVEPTLPVDEADPVDDEPVRTAPVPVVVADPEDPDDLSPTDETPRRRWLYALVAFLVLLGGAGVAVALSRDEPVKEAKPPKPVVLPIPTLVGLTTEQATQLLDASGWKIKTISKRQNDTKMGDLLGSSPEAGERLSKGQTVTLVVSEGQEMVELPQGLQGRPIDEVAKAFKDAGLKTRVAQKVHHEEFGKDTLVQYVDGTPGTAERGSEIGLVASDGPAPREVPSGLAGSTAAEARRAIEAVQLDVKVVNSFSDTVKEGIVISQSPEGGQVARGATVTITVSKGPELVSVPDISWTESIKQATQVLKNAGLAPGSVSGPAEGSPKTTKPGYGTKVRKGTKIDIVVG